MSYPHSKRASSAPLEPRDAGATSAACETCLLDIAALADGQLTAEGMRRLRAHTDGCEACRRVMHDMMDDAPDPPRHGSAWTPLVPPDDT